MIKMIQMFLPTGELFPASFWLSYWEYLEAYVEARRTLDALRAVADPLLDFLRLKQAAARHSPSALLLLPVSLLLLLLLLSLNT